MNIALLIAAGLITIVGFAHSFLGERYILVRLFRRQDLPSLFGSDRFTRDTLRMAWHLTTVVWWGIGVLLIIAARKSPALSHADLGAVVAGTSGVSAIVAFVGTRGRHLAWVAFSTVAILSWLGTH